MKLLRTVALDPSDTFVFDPAAEPGEWAVPGTFRFWSDDPTALQGKARSAFRGGFLGLQSWGWSTLVQVVDVKDGERDMVVDLLAHRLVERLGAPDLAVARRAAEDEVAFAESLCSEPAGILIAIRRTVEDGEIRETFRTLRSRCGSQPHRAFSFVEVDDERSAEEIDLAGAFLGHESK
ncbi:DUF6505 family protein [Nitrobacter sp.]|uniref:DUF6505 family protein n=1 Tax=Nitrobacter sp. TaxID=29420 RepID=UPI0029CABA08|nr:DUF6505 family protein [Nitrobacter sp.]